MNSKTKTFRVPTGIAPKFANKIAEYDLPCELMGANKKDELLFDVDYKPNERNKIHDLIDLIDEHLDEMEEEEYDDDEEEEDDEDEEDED